MENINIEDIPLDDMYHLKVLTPEIFESLQECPPNLVITHRLKMVMSDIKVEVLNKTYLKKFHINAIRMSLGYAHNYQIPETEQIDPYVLPLTFADLVDYAKNIRKVVGEGAARVVYYYEIPVSKGLFPYLLSFFTVYPEFGPVYEEYMDNPDTNVRFADEDSPLSETYRKSGGVTANDLRMSAH